MTRKESAWEAQAYVWKYNMHVCQFGDNISDKLIATQYIIWWRNSVQV